jgi:hypothetical protein
MPKRRPPAQPSFRKPPVEHQFKKGKSGNPGISGAKVIGRRCHDSLQLRLARPLSMSGNLTACEYRRRNKRRYLSGVRIKQKLRCATDPIHPRPRQ